METLLEERADRLEAALGHFIVSTGNALSRMERGLDDLIDVSETAFIINETKSTPRMDYVIDFINIVKEIPGYFPESAGNKIIPIFSSLYIHEDAVKYLSERKVYAMAMGDETMEILNFDQLDP